MKKRLFIFFTVLALLMSIALPVLAEDEDIAAAPPSVISEAPDSHPDRLVDDANLLSDSEKASLLAYLNEISERQQFDIVIVTVYSLDGKTPEAYADDYYDYNGYGFGANHDGCLLLVSMEARDWAISTTGYGITALTDAGQAYIVEQFKPALSSGDYASAFNIFAKNVHSFVIEAMANKPYDRGHMPKSQADTKEILKRVIISLIIGLIIALVITKKIKADYTKAVRQKANATDYLVGGSLQVTGSYDNFLYTNVTKTRIEKDSGGSSTHSGSSGTSHGGSSGKF